MTGDPADQRLFLVDHDGWATFVDALERPAQHKPRLASLLAEPSELVPHTVGLSVPSGQQ